MLTTARYCALGACVWICTSAAWAQSAGSVPKKPAASGTGQQPLATGKSQPGGTTTIRTQTQIRVNVSSKSAAPNAQPGDGAAAGNGKPRPPAQQLVVEPIPPELEELLKLWETQSAKIKQLEGRHERSEVNNVFQVEKLSVGEFWFDAPDRGRMDIKGRDPAKDEVSKLVDKEGKPFKLQSGEPSRWICTGQDVLVIDDAAKTYEVFPIPPDFQGESISRSPLPFLFGMKAEDAKRRFAMKLVKDNENYAVIQAIPRRAEDSRNYSKALIQLDRRRFVPIAVQITDPAQTIITTYRFAEVKVNGGNIAQRFAGALGGDPFKPNLRSFKPIVQPDAPPLQPTANKTVPGASGQVRPGNFQQSPAPKTGGSPAPKSASTRPPAGSPPAVPRQK